jgi:protease IV
VAVGLEADLLLDRRRLKRRLFFWRVLAILLGLGVIGLATGARMTTFGGSRHVERISVTGIITQNQKLIDAVDALGKDSNVAAVIVAVDSPGGSVSGGESLHDALVRLAALRPVVTVMGGTAASAGYMISLPAARIFASAATLTGSIGVILETGNAGGLLDKLGLSAEAIISGPLKDQPSFTHGLSPEGRTYLQALVMDMYGQFVTMVATARHLDESKVRTLADGRAYTGRQALPLGLIDEIGGEPEARAWLERDRQVPASLPVRDLKLGGLYERTIGATLEGLWPASLTQMLPQPGAWAIWRPDAF